MSFAQKMAIPALSQLTHSPQPAVVDSGLLSQEAMAFLLRLHLNFARTPTSQRKIPSIH
jgi:hypothetical protein